ncbi:hypothetical protein GGI21_002190 [Coemansia aciculifera]|uniref:Uncharacterized protein n=1 Tax=Coemansia aciculifera TaxID=417176 RepID=A0ACC1M877_9FUNG|nr:hypothetical protein IWW38_001153 [Coemansia aciculifera]KAJ2909132.1 hypothetical protein GGI21_002190 [Coemansia aciculifera]
MAEEHHQRRQALQHNLSRRRHAPESFNVMVAGRRGVGKSTLLQTLCDSFYSLKIEALSEGDKVMFTNVADATEAAPSPSIASTSAGLSAEEVLDPFCVFDSLSGSTEIRRCRVRIRDLTHNHPVCVELVDTPGIDSFDEASAIATIDAISLEIERRLQATLDDEIRPQRNKATPAAHIHAIVYVLPPPVYSSAQTDSPSHRLDFAVGALSDIDVMAIRKLAQFANVILAVGKCDTMDKAERKVFDDDREFFTQAHDVIFPARLYDFSDYPPSSTGSRGQHPRESRDDRIMTRNIRKSALNRLPFKLCGSKHVEEWQKMRLPEYQTSQSRVSVTDWRILTTEHNRICSSANMITDGIFRDRRAAVALGANGIATGGGQQHPRHASRPYYDSMSSVYSLALNSDTVTIKRLHQKRQVSLVRELCCGTLQITNRNHCDFALLVDLLFHSYRRSLEAWTDEFHYEEYRAQHIAADPTYAAYSQGMTEYLEAERSRRIVPKVLAHPPVATTATTTTPSQKHQQGSWNASRRHKENGWSLSSAMIADDGIRETAEAAANSTRDGNATRHKSTIVNDSFQFQYSFPVPTADAFFTSPPDTAVSATPPPSSPHRLRDLISTSRSKATRDSHRTSAATTLTTIVPLTNPLTPSPETVKRLSESTAVVDSAAVAKSTRFRRRFTLGSRAKPVSN